MQERLIQELIQPETEMEKHLVAQAEFRQGLFWGKPRYGHPEGQIIFHIREVLDNVERIPDLDKETRTQLRLITLVHDTFKYKEAAASKILGRVPESHHATFAAEFMMRHNGDESLTRIIHLHDEAYYSWRMIHRFQSKQGWQRMADLLSAIGQDLQLYYLFFKCDTCTGDKTPKPLEWFEQQVQGIQVMDFN